MAKQGIKEQFENYKGDKRSKKYKELKAEYQKYKEKFEADNTEGIGDKVEKITKATGIKKAVKWLAGEDCGCDKRKEKLNKLPLKFNALQCPTEDQFKWMDNYFKNERSNKIPMHVQNNVNNILTHVYKRRFKPLNCCFGGRIKMLEDIYKAYV